MYWPVRQIFPGKEGVDVLAFTANLLLKTGTGNGATGSAQEMEKLDGKQDYGSFDRVNSTDSPQHVPGNPFVKASVAPSCGKSNKPAHNNGNQYEEKYLQVAETSFSRASPL